MAIIVCPQPQAAEIGLEVMRRGGNAVDAAVTCAFVQGVIDPQMCGIGGGGVMLVHSPSSGDSLLEFYPVAGSLVREDMWAGLFLREAADRYGFVLDGWVNDVGYQSVCVPGTVLGLHEALSRFGTISWADAIKPSIPIARDGFPVSGFMHGYWTTDYGPDVVPNAERIQATPAARALYTHDGSLYAIGEVLVQADLARTLSRLAAGGPEEFYRGSIAASIASDFAAHGGFITAADLASYRVHVGSPLEGTYRGLRVVSAGPPAGGLVLHQMLGYLERFDLRASGWPSTDSARLLVEAMQRELVADRADTTHVCVVDDAGMAVSLTHTLGSASGVVTAGLGFGYNDYMNCFDPRPGRPGSIQPGRTRFTRMVPTMVFDGSSLRVCVGAPGGTKIVGAVLQVLVNLIDHQMSAVEAVSAPRVDFQGDVVQAEARVPRVVVEGLTRLGFKVNRRTLNYDSYFARPQVIASSIDGVLSGASDPRKDGGAAFSTETK